jgi:hypothetical protein
MARSIEAGSTPLENLSRPRVDAPQFALVTFPGAVPELSIDPGNAGDEAVGLAGLLRRRGQALDTTKRGERHGARR